MTTKHEAYAYQLDAVRAIENLEYSAIFHEQGLGKTKIAIDLMLSWLVRDVVDTLFVVTKKTLVTNWSEEIVNHSHITPHILASDRNRIRIALNSPVLIFVMNYEVISTNMEMFGDFLRTCRVGIFLDESQKIKNPESTITKNFLSLSDEFARRVIITGTPVANRPYDIWAQIKFLDNGASLGDSYSTFKSEFDLPTDSNLEAFDKYTNRLMGITDRIREFTVRETKETAGLELPSKSILTHFVDLAPKQSAIYKRYRNEFCHEFKALGETIVDNAEDLLKRLLRFIQCAANPKLLDSSYTETPAKYDKLVEILGEINLSKRKVIVWTSFVENAEWLASRLQEFNPRQIHGRMSVEERALSVATFKNSDTCKILVATPGAAKEGLTLTIASHAIFFDRSFSLDDYIQAQDRIHRISQKENCYVHNLIANETLDEWVDMLLTAKYIAAQVAQGDITDTEDVDPFGQRLHDKLIEMLSAA